MTHARIDPTTSPADRQARSNAPVTEDAIRPEADPVSPRSTAPLTPVEPEATTTTSDRGERAPAEQERLTTADLASRDVAPAPRVTETRTSKTDESTGNGRAALFDGTAAEQLRVQWMEIQTGFVDEPRRAVEDADSLVADVMQRLADSFARERQNLERQWSQGDDVSTEDLRLALRRYRSFFDRLLTM